MIKVNKIISSEKRNNLRKEYIKTLVEPIDGYWETVVIDNSECYEIIRNDTIVGHFSIEKDKTLVQFYLSTEHYIYASDILKYFIENNIVKERAMLIEEQYFKKNYILEDCGFMDRVGGYNVARDVAEEVVLNEIVYR